MPPGSQKGTSKKSGSALPKPSRTSTPQPPTGSLPEQKAYDPDYLNTRVILLESNLAYEDLVDSVSSNAAVPDSRSIDALLAKLKDLSSVIEKRTNFYDRGMRFLADERKKRPDDYVPEDEGKRPKHKKKKTSESLAPPEIGSTSKDGRPSSNRGTKRKHSREPSSSLSPVAGRSPSAMDVDTKEKKDDEEDKTDKKEEEGESSSEDEGAPPRREMPAHQTFGEDPSTFPDPTIYEIREIKPEMTEEEKKEIYSVAGYPASDLADLIAGDPPDNDYSVAKPTSQINFSTFSSYVEPYFRPFSEEDLGFLRERGDRVTPFLMPRQGKRHYTEIWAEEDGGMSMDSPDQMDRLPANMPRGTIENMNDTVAETDGLSIGPVAARLLQALRPENRAPAEEKPATNGATNGDIVMNGDPNGEEPTENGANGPNGEKAKDPIPPATFMDDSTSEAWKKATYPKLDYNQVDERLKQELRHIGFLPPDGVEPDYDGAFDDEVAGRIRTLQERLREQMLINGARKSKLTEIIRERMAHQEYNTILEDLDTQVQAAYTKRTRTMGKSKKAKRPGGAGGGSHFVGSGAQGTARPGIGDLTKTLMERRKKWIRTIGGIFDDETLAKVPRMSDPDSSIFKPTEMGEYLKKEKQQWDEEVEDE
ncbi:histone acetyltransferases subunit 3-domain-containing protein [Emericellopsis atlantica]|uniref:Histone acetyltransferases subunit 3-domain-containing protein n=1 Tax=Emericellopsis atlantica TaxID=2614577 RepID=A0A9P7ZPT6_9HYPO|nr:histone acetyltransferases subunit 3-domain-containing protein [Emericellopsis atlantica]KAG9255881.1 histone acetyltransferases subunit 3-domain-containing protein [Emericellopsis atlantica]